MAKHAAKEGTEGSMRRIGEGLATDQKTGETVKLIAFMLKPSRHIVATRGGGKHRRKDRR